MQVILMEKVENLGELGELVSVKPGYARNFLVPQGKAKMATEANMAEFEARRAEFEAAAAAARQAAEQRKAALNGLEKVVITSKVGSEGKLFGSIGTADIADAITAAGVEVTRAEVRLPNGALRQTGDFEIDVHLYTDIDAVITVEVVGEE